MFKKCTEKNFIVFHAVISDVLCSDLVLYLHIFRENETRILKELIDKLNNNIGREEEKAKDLEIKARCSMIDFVFF